MIATDALVERPRAYEDLTLRGAFVALLDHEQHKLKAVLTDYHFTQQVPCGLKGCRQPHNHGFLVITDSGAETNVGKDCGRTYFGDEVFSTAFSAYEAKRQRADLIARMRGLQAEAEAIAARAKDPVFRAFGGKWVKKVQAALEKLLGSGLMQSLSNAQLRGELTVTSAIERSDDEIREAMALNPSLTRERARYDTVSIGILEPMPWIDYDFTGKLLRPFVDDLRLLLTIDPDKASTPILRKKLKPFERLDAEITGAEEACAAAVRFLSERNLQLVCLWVPEHFRGRADALRQWINSRDHQDLLSGRC